MRPSPTLTARRRSRSRCCYGAGMSRAAILVSSSQLLDPHPLLAALPAAEVVAFEDPLLVADPAFDPGWSDPVLAWRRAALEAWLAGDQLAGRSVTAIRVGDAATCRSELAAAGARAEEQLGKVVARLGELHVLDPCDDWREQRLARHAAAGGCRLVTHPTPGFLLSREDAIADLGTGRPRMASFYRRQRIRHDILLGEDGEPVGGRWSFDEDNRKRLPRALARELPPWPWPAPPDGDGSGQVAFPTTHVAARRWLDAFVAERLERFGPYEDAMHAGQPLLFHAAITPMLNHGLLTPRQVLDAVMARADDAPLQSVEGFVRQLIGWREYVRATYAAHGRRLRSGNAWQHHGSLPRGLAGGTTGLAPVDDVMQRVRELGWCHHIERLMVLGNYLFLTETHPDEAYRFFMASFTDALDWVMVPNVYGMSQDAAGGLMTTKPYFSGASYIRRMGSFPRGEWEELWTSLYWRFIIRHSDELAGNARWAMPCRTAARFDAATRDAHLRRAEAHIEACR